jgi:hypothetical protein
MAHIKALTDKLSKHLNKPANLPEESEPLTSTLTNMSTPTAIESQPPQCPDCHGMGFFRLDVPPGDRRFGKPVPCDNPLHTAERLDRAAQLSNLHPGDLARRLADIDPNTGNSAMLIAACKMVDNPAGPAGWLYIWGGPGNAKSEVLIAMVNEVNEAGRGPAMYVTYSHLVNWVREAHRPDATESYIKRLERLKALRLIAVDETDKARDTEFSQEFRFEFLDERYRQGILGTSAMVFASNTDPALLPLPLYDRVRDGRFTIVENTAPSARPHMRTNQ